jgi:hypothetical protein
MMLLTTIVFARNLVSSAGVILPAVRLAVNCQKIGTRSHKEVVDISRGLFSAGKLV